MALVFSQIQNSISNRGGALDLMGGTLAVSGTTFSRCGDRGTRSTGGVMHVGGMARAVILSSTVRNGTSRSHEVYVAGTSKATVLGSLICLESVGFAKCESGSSMQLDVVDCLVVGGFHLNCAHSTAPNGQIILSNCTLIEVGALCMSGAISVLGCTFTGGRWRAVGGLLTFARCTSSRVGIPSRGSMFISLEGGEAILVDSSIDSAGVSVVVEDETATHSTYIKCESGKLVVENTAIRNTQYFSFFTISGGEIVVSNSLFENIKGGLVYSESGYTQLTNTTMSNVRRFAGGTVYSTGGRIELHACTVHDSQATRFGGGVASMLGGTLTISHARITLSYAGSGGCIFMFPGSVVHIVNTTVEESYGFGGACFAMNGGMLNITHSNLHCSTLRRNGNALQMSESPTGTILLATFVHFRLTSCRKVFVGQGNVTSVLRQISFIGLPGCSTSDLASVGAFEGVEPSHCGDSYHSISDGQRYGVCSSQRQSACAMHPVNGTVLKSLSCTCPVPSYVDPVEVLDTTTAPYLPAGGCVEPLMLDSIVRVSQQLVAVLEKPGQSEQAYAVILRLQGTDTKNVPTWHLLNASLIQRRSSWVHMPYIHGSMDPASLLSER